MSVEETLAAAAKATEAAAQATPKKERVKKGAVGAEGGAAPAEAKAPRVKKEAAPKKQYPQANEDGTQKFEEDGVTPVMGAYATRYKEPKAPKAPRETSGKFPGSAVITVLVDKNPKREGSASHARFEFYKSGQTVKEALEAGLTTGDFHHDVAHNFISIAVGEVKEAEQAGEAA